MAEPFLGGAPLTAQAEGTERPRWNEYVASWTALHGGVDLQAGPSVVRAWLRLSYGLGRALAAMRLSPGAVTLVGLLASAAVPVLALFGGAWLFAAASLVFVSALADSADGAVAMLTGRATRRGAFDDALADRLGEVAWLLALWILGAPGWLAVVCGGLVWLHEYARARATACGMTGIGVITVAERPTRIMTVIAALTLAALAWGINPSLAPGIATVFVSLWTVMGFLAIVRLIGSLRSILRVGGA